MKPATWIRLSLDGQGTTESVSSAVTAAVVSCYTLPSARKKKVDFAATAAASAELHDVIYGFVQETLYTYPHLATRAGMHTYRLPSGEDADLDRELPNYSTDLVDARIESLEATMERLENKVPEAALSPNDLSDRHLLIAAARLELLDWKDLEIHRRDPLLHARSLAEALYYPLVVAYAPEEERLADVLGRLHWAPAYLERAARMIESTSEPLAAAAVEVNRFTISLVRDELDARIPKDGELRTAYEGMKGPVLEALDGFQRFLEKDVDTKKKVTWRLGRKRYEERFSLAFHGAMTVTEAREAADEAVATLGRELFALAKPAYCEANEKDREICGPTRAELAAAARAEQERLRKEEEKKKRAAAEERKRQQQEERKAAAEERKQQEEEKKQAAAEERKRQEEEKRKAADEKKKEEEEKAKKKKDIPNPYADPPKKEEKKSPGGVLNPYGWYRLPEPIESAGAKLAGQDDTTAEESQEKKSAKTAKKDEPAPKKDEPTAAMVARVVAFVFDLLRKPDPGGEASDVARLENGISTAAGLASQRGVLDTASADGLSVEEAPALFAAMNRPLLLVPQPVFQPVQGARLFVVNTDRTGLAATRTFAVAAAMGSPGRFEALRRAVEIEPETRRALRVLHGDSAWLSGWGLYAAERLARAEADAAGEGTPRALLEALAEVVRAAVELSVDIRMHTGDLSEKDATAELISRAGLESSVAEQRVRWLVTAPLEAEAAFVGYRAWSRAGTAAGDRATFHARALALGPVPTPDLEPLLATADPDATPDYEGPAPAEPEPEGKRHVSVLDAL